MPRALDEAGILSLVLIELTAWWSPMPPGQECQGDQFDRRHIGNDRANNPRSCQINRVLRVLLRSRWKQ